MKRPIPPRERSWQGARQAIVEDNRIRTLSFTGGVAAAREIYIDIGIREGAKLVCGGRKLKEGEYRKGFFTEPTLFESTHGLRITKEEIFGPVLSVIKVGSYEEAVHVAKDADYGLSSSIYTGDINTAYRAIDDLEAGITYVNAPTIGAEVPLPFIGVKNTGNGAREAGSAAIAEFTEIKTVFIDYSGRLQKAQIDR